jgi:transposase-like protein
MERKPWPQGGSNYPRNLVEFDERFRSEAACEAYLLALRWPEGFVCPKCEGGHYWWKARGLLVCRTCGRETSVTAGTLFHKTRKPLRLWFHAIWWVTSQKYGANALGLQRVLGLGSYQTAWTWLHKLRRAMVRPGRDRLQGEVEVDESYVGGIEEGVYGRETEDKAIVAVAAEIRGRGTGRIRLRQVTDVSGDALRPFVQDVVEPGSVIVTDGWGAYSGLVELGYVHRKHNVSRSGKKAHEVLPRVHRAASLLKRWILGTHQGAVSRKHLDYYLDEFTFRFNRRTSAHRGLLFYRLMQQAVHLEPTTYSELVRGRDADG